MSILSAGVILACLGLAANTALADAGVPVTRIPLDAESVAVCSWLVSGQFPSPRLENPLPSGPTGAAFDIDYLEAIGGEVAARIDATTAVAMPETEPVTFSLHEWGEAYVDLNRIHEDTENVCVYLYAHIECEDEHVAYVHAGTNSAGKVWLGGERIVSHPGDRVAMPSQHVVRVTLKAGRTPVLMKIDHDGGGWGAFFEVYGQSAHSAYVQENFPVQLALEALNPLPEPGAAVEVSVTNWIPSDPALPITWRLIDSDQTDVRKTLDARASFSVPAGPQRTVTIQAAMPHPQGGQATGECVVLTGGVSAARNTLGAFQSARDEIGDPLRLEGARRDAYAQALYRFERLQRDNPTLNLDALTTATGQSIALLHEALATLRNEGDPYADRTGLFEGAYLCPADGTAQPFMLSVPTEYADDEPCALLVYLHGAGQTHEAPNRWWQPVADAAHARDTIGVAPLGRGLYCGYTGLAEDDVFRVIRWVKSHYAIDEDRVYLIGSSMGGAGTWRLAAQCPGVFAAAMADCGWVSYGLLPNLLHLPFYANCGEVDWGLTVHSRLGTNTLRELGSPVVYHEYPGVDHAVGIPVTAEGYMTRLARHRRQTEPDHIRIHARHPRYADMYWGRIVGWQDPHRAAHLQARILPGNVVSLSLSNVAQARVEPPARFLDEGRDIVWLVAGRRMATPQSPNGVYDVIVTDDDVVVDAQTDNPTPKTRPYVPGSFMELYRGEPLLIVYGTQAKDAALSDAIRTMAENLSRMSMPMRVMEFGRIPVVPDIEATDDLCAGRNLFLVGGPDSNAVTRRLMPQMPVREESGAFAIFDAEPIPLAGRGYGVVYPNPEHPKRLVFVYASADPAFYGLEWGPRGSLILRDGSHDPAIPDLFVEEMDPARPNRVVRLATFTHGWQLQGHPDEVVTRHPASDSEFQAMKAEALRRVSCAAYVLGEKGSADDPAPYDSATMAWPDIALLLATENLMVFNATGQELLDLAVPKDGQDWALFPTPDADAIDARAIYPVAVPDHLLWKLSSHEYSPRHPQLLPAGARFEEAAREVWGVTTR